MSKIVKNKLKAARIAITEKRYDNAYDLSKDVLEWESENYNALIFLGVASQNLGKVEESEEAYLTAIKTDDSQILAWQGLASLYEKNNNTEKQLNVLDNLYFKYSEAKNYSKAIEILKNELLIYQTAANREKQIELWKTMLDSVSFQDGSEKGEKAIDAKLEAGWPSESECLDSLCTLIDRQNTIGIPKEIYKRRNRIDAPPIIKLTEQVKQEYAVNSRLYYYLERKLLLLEDGPLVLFKDMQSTIQSIESDLKYYGLNYETSGIFGVATSTSLARQEALTDLWEKYFTEAIQVVAANNAKAELASSELSETPDSDTLKLFSATLLLVANSRNPHAHILLIDALDLDYNMNLFQNILNQYTTLFDSNDIFSKSAIQWVNFFSSGKCDSANQVSDSTFIESSKDADNGSFFKSNFVSYIKTRSMVDHYMYGEAISYSKRVLADLNATKSIFSLSLKRTRSLFYLEIGYSYSFMGKNYQQLAKSAFISCLEMFITDISVAAAIGLSNIYTKEENYGKAINLLESVSIKISESDNQNHDILIQTTKINAELGQLHLKLNNVEKAQQLIKSTLTQMPDWVDGKIALGDIYWNLYLASGDSTNRMNAFRQYVESAKLDQKNETAFVRLGVWYQDAYQAARTNGDDSSVIKSLLEKAKSCLLKGFSINPGNPIAVKGVVSLILKNVTTTIDENAIRAVELLNQSLERNHSQMWAWKQLGLLQLYVFKDYNASAKSFVNSIKHSKKQSGKELIDSLVIAYEGLAESFMYCGKLSSAQKAAEMAKKYLFFELPSIEAENYETGALLLPPEQFCAKDELFVKRATVCALLGDISFYKNEFNLSIDHFTEAEQISNSLLNFGECDEGDLKYSEAKRKDVFNHLLRRIRHSIIKCYIRFATQLKQSGMYGSSESYIYRAITLLNDELFSLNDKGDGLLLSPWLLLNEASVLLFGYSSKLVDVGVNASGNSGSIQQNVESSYFESCKQIIIRSISWFAELFRSYQESDGNISDQNSNPVISLFHENLPWLHSISDRISGHINGSKHSIKTECSLSISLVSAMVMVANAPTVNLAASAWNTLGKCYYFMHTFLHKLTIISDLPFHSINDQDVTTLSDITTKTVSYDISSNLPMVSNAGNTQNLQNGLFCAQAALQLDPADSDSIRLLSVIAYKLNLPKLAQHGLIGCILLDRLNSHYWSSLGCFYMILGYSGLAAKCYDLSVACDPENSSAFYGIGILNYLFLGNIELGLNYLKQSIELGGSTKISSILAFSRILIQYPALCSKQNLSMGIFEQKKVCEQKTNDPTSWYTLGLLLERNGEYNLAKSSFQTAYECFDSENATAELKSLIKKMIVLGLGKKARGVSNNSCFSEIDPAKLNSISGEPASSENNFIRVLSNIDNFTVEIEKAPIGANVSDVTSKISDHLVSKLHLCTLDSYARNCCATGEFVTSIQAYTIAIEKSNFESIISQSCRSTDGSTLSYLMYLFVGLGKALFLNENFSESLTQFEIAIKLCDEFLLVDPSQKAYKYELDTMLAQILWSLGTAEHKSLACQHLGSFIFVEETEAFLSNSNVLGTTRLTESIAKALKVLLTIAVLLANVELSKAAINYIEKLPVDTLISHGLPLLTSLHYLILENDFKKAKRVLERYAFKKPNSNELWSQITSLYLFASLIQADFATTVYLNSTCLLDGIRSLRPLGSVLQSSKHVAKLGGLDTPDNKDTMASRKDLTLQSQLSRAFSLLLLGESLNSDSGSNEFLSWSPSNYTVPISNDMNTEHDEGDTNISAPQLATNKIGIAEKRLQNLSLKDSSAEALVDKQFSKNSKIARQIMFRSYNEMAIKKSKFSASKAIMLKPTSSMSWRALTVANSCHLQYCLAKETTTTVDYTFVYDTISSKKSRANENYKRFIAYTNSITQNTSYSNNSGKPDTEEDNSDINQQIADNNLVLALISTLFKAKNSSISIYTRLQEAQYVKYCGTVGQISKNSMSVLEISSSHTSVLSEIISEIESLSKPTSSCGFNLVNFLTMYFGKIGANYSKKELTQSLDNVNLENTALLTISSIGLLQKAINGILDGDFKVTGEYLFLPELYLLQEKCNMVTQYINLNISGGKYMLIELYIKVNFLVEIANYVSKIVRTTHNHATDTQSVQFFKLGNFRNYSALVLDSLLYIASLAYNSYSELKHNHKLYTKLDDMIRPICEILLKVYNSDLLSGINCQNNNRTPPSTISTVLTESPRVVNYKLTTLFLASLLNYILDGDKSTENSDHLSDLILKFAKSDLKANEVPFPRSVVASKPHFFSNFNQNTFLLLNLAYGLH